jgi:hypothetical protein
MNTLSMKTSTSGGANVMQSIDIQSFSYQERSAVIPLLTNSFANCGGWVLERRTLSTTTVEFRLEIQLLAVLDLYAAILSAGVELTRGAHLSLTDLCTCRKHLRTAELGKVVALRIEVSFLEDITLHSLLQTLSPPA